MQVSPYVSAVSLRDGGHSVDDGQTRNGFRLVIACVSQKANKAITVVVFKRDITRWCVGRSPYLAHRLDLHRLPLRNARPRPKHHLNHRLQIMAAQQP